MGAFFVIAHCTPNGNRAYLPEWGTLVVLDSTCIPQWLGVQEDPARGLTAVLKSIILPTKSWLQVATIDDDIEKVWTPSDLQLTLGHQTSTTSAWVGRVDTTKKTVVVSTSYRLLATIIQEYDTCGGILKKKWHLPSLSKLESFLEVVTCFYS